MKKSLLYIGCALVYCTLVVLGCQASEKPWYQTVTLSTVGAYKQASFTGGPSEWGAGVDVGLPINPFVSIHVRNLSYEGNNGSWDGSVVDETTVYGKANFAPFKGDKFYLYGTGGGSRHWGEEDWSFGVGVGVEYKFTKNISASVGREVRAYFKGTKDWLSTASVNFSF